MPREGCREGRTSQATGMLRGVIHKPLGSQAVPCAGEPRPPQQARCHSPGNGQGASQWQGQRCAFHTGAKAC
eukprot:4968225-Lingulodinium_polyedra.AAC.1